MKTNIWPNVLPEQSIESEAIILIENIVTKVELNLEKVSGMLEA